ncbi:hypothetical protein IW140_000238 [Coemansia sp. RSA 1813]|nr:hypothetical protein EV178_000441 [Coemansia sp. RSA 1646]KAJ1773788.1 hypothetical protein LPJ74_000332 [Coemansia sp. RSA 1843]KAJ2093751.1 hypothetical protein IW138_000147 [Coemansia sp. RSA 986]KAJ2217962.1 hypothetical protein EV179_000107 [Coemansia sp. RSA 487]KAJ2573195.1 hypothetical protein IW140_000238 [Coemansia sp. RSA 1813]
MFQPRPLLYIAAIAVAAIVGLSVAPRLYTNKISALNDGIIFYDPDAPTLALKTSALESGNIPFTSHASDKPFGTYLQQTLDFGPFKELFDAISTTTNTAIHSRGEAHITVISPPEFDHVLKPAGVTIEEIESIALRSGIQDARLVPVCLGRFSGTLPNPKTDADKGTFLLYSLVVADVHNDLLAIRRKVFEVYREKGGQGALFQPEGFWPHVTLGFDRRDLFIEDSIYKGSNYCYAPIRMVR